MQDYKNEKNLVECTLCPRLCKISDEKIGFCNVRQNIGGKLYTLVYGKAAALQIDPIEKKPLFHFLPSSNVFSVGTLGCNLRCKFCQNYHTSQTKHGKYHEQDITPREVVELAIDNNCRSIATTYNEPTIFYEYVLDIFKEAKKHGLKTVMVSNGFICKEPLNELCKYLDGINVDIKAFTNKFYGSITASWLAPILDTIKLLHEKNVWFEMTNLMIPTLNDNPDETRQLCKWILENIGDKYPLHFTGFHPDFKLLDLPATPKKTLMTAYNIAKEAGLKYVYVGNLLSGKAENTYCHKCNELLIKRHGYFIEENFISKGRCKFCMEKIQGIFE